MLEQIIQEIEKERGNELDYTRPEDKRLVRHWNNCIDVVLEIIQSHMNDGWIPVDDHLPNDWIRNCFVQMKHIESTGDGFKTILSWDGYENCWKWHNGKKISEIYKVLAWQPVKYPDTYKPEVNIND